MLNRFGFRATRKNDAVFINVAPAGVAEFEDFLENVVGYDLAQVAVSIDGNGAITLESADHMYTWFTVDRNEAVLWPFAPHFLGGISDPVVVQMGELMKYYEIN